MKKLTPKEYYDMSNELDYVIPSDNVADCKLQMRIGEPDAVRTLYGMNEDADQFMLSEIGKDTFFIQTSLDEVLDELGVAHEE